MKKLLATVTDIHPIKPISLVDIGARWGIQRPWYNVPAGYLNYVGFDADAEECKRLNSAPSGNNVLTYLPVALSDEVSTETLFLTDEEGCSSIYKPDYKYINRYYFKEQWRIKKELRVSVTTLQHVFSEHNITPDFIKIDTQGAELNILRGADKYIDAVLGLELEVEFVPLYNKQPLFSDIDSFVRARGFEIFDLNRYWAKRTTISRYSSSRGQLIFGDAIYFRSIDSFYAIKFNSMVEHKEKLLKLVLLLSLYGFIDAAIEYIRHESTPLNDEEISKLSHALQEMGRFPQWQQHLFNNKFAGKLGRLFKLLGSMLSVPLNTHGWGTDYNAVDGRYPYFRKMSKKG